jgi:hypothetical protein
MTPAPRWRSTLAFAAGALACSFSWSAPRPRAACTAAQLPPRHERLSQVLEELSALHSVRVSNRTGVDPMVRHAGGSEWEVMRSLVGQANLVVRYKAVAGCPGLWRVKTVWVLPRENAEPTVAKVPRPLSPREEADAATARKAMGLYLKGHSFDPTKQPDPAASAASTPTAKP